MAPFAIKHAKSFSLKPPWKLRRLATFDDAISGHPNLEGFIYWLQHWGLRLLKFYMEWKLNYWQVPFSRRATTLSFYTMIGWCYGSFTPYTYSAAFGFGLVTSVNASRLRSDFPLNRHMSYQKISAHIVTEKEYHIRKLVHIY